MIDLTEFGYVPALNTNPDTIARITAVHKERFEIASMYGITYARLKSSLYFNDKDARPDASLVFPTVGDFVQIQYNDSGDSLIVKTMERRTYFSRLDPRPGGHIEQAVAANFDYVFILTSLNHDFNEKRLERYLTLAWQSGATPVILLTKADLVEDSTEQKSRIEQFAFGVDLHVVSAVSGYGLNELSKYLTPRTTVVFLGSSGVGKSSLLNALAGDEIMKVNEIREDDSKGRHTTTHRQLIKLSSGVMIIDTPGMRTLGMWDVTDGLGEAFGDVDEYVGKCRFSNCTHNKEPGCAVRDALESGLISAERWQSYTKLKREARFSDRKDAAKARQQLKNMTHSKYERERVKFEIE